MAITYNLPIKRWYFDKTSEWTLDYPPLFAAFEFLISMIAHFLQLQDSLILSKSAIRTESIVKFQKVSVILSDCVYYYAVYKICKAIEHFVPRVHQVAQKEPQDRSEQSQTVDTSSQSSLIHSIYRPDTTSCVAILLLFQPGLMLVDHVHFQYNGFLSGIFLLALAYIIEENYWLGATWFTVLLNFKHIYLYCAPAFGMYILTSFCLAKSDGENRIFSSTMRISKMGLLVKAIFMIIYAPFADVDTLEQVISRLFPFQRGLTHAYWAPNIWSLYNTADKILAQVFKDSLKVKFDMDSLSRTKPISSTSGLVREYEHQYLPTIQPIHTFALVALFTIPLVIKFLLNIRTSPKLFIKGVTLASFTAFMFGWHVHEKAIIVVLLPMIILFCVTPRLRPTFLRLSLAGTYSLFPLLFERAECVTKWTLLAAYCGYAYSLEHETHSKKPVKSSRLNQLMLLGHRLYTILDTLFVLAIIVVEVYVTLIHGRLNYSWNPIAKLNKYDFLPLMLTSSLSAVGVTASYLELYYDFLCCADAIA